MNRAAARRRCLDRAVNGGSVDGFAITLGAKRANITYGRLRKRRSVACVALGEAGQRRGSHCHPRIFYKTASWVLLI